MLFKRVGLMTALVTALAVCFVYAADNDNNDAKDSKDGKFLTEAAQGGIMEVELGRLAVTNGQNDAVKKFGQRMIDDHSKANDELRQLMSKRDLPWPRDLDRKQRHEVDKLSKLMGADFDHEYIELMLKDHQKDIAEFEKEAKEGDDAEAKDFADKTLAVLREHLAMAKDAAGQVGVKVDDKGMDKDHDMNHDHD